MKRLLLVACLTVFGYSFATAEDYTPGDLTGAWEGTPPMGGKLFINIEVSPGGDIKGKGDISERWFPNVFGKVDGRKINLNYWFPLDNNDSTVRFLCDWVEKTRLACVTRNKKFETEFTKVR